MHTDLGGGEDDHLGLICSLGVYRNLFPKREPYFQPESPGRLQLELCKTQYKTTYTGDKYTEETRVIREVISIERAIHQQLE